MPRRPPHDRSRSSTSAERLVEQARACFRSRKFDEALDLYARAAREFRTDFAVFIEAARAYALRYRPDQAHAFLARALRLAGRRADVQYLVGQSYRLLGEMRLAEACFHRAIALVDQAPRVHLGLAELYERTHRLSEAREHCEKVLRQEPRAGAAMVLKARILRRLGEFEACANYLSSALQSGFDTSYAAEAWGELALAYDAMGSYDEAWQAVANAKRIQLTNCDAENQAARIMADRFGRLAIDMSPEHLARWMSLDPIESSGPALGLLTGFPRSGTTLLERVLDAHPRIRSVEERPVMGEDVVPFLSRLVPDLPFCVVLDRLDPPSIHEARAIYWKNMSVGSAPASGPELLLDKNPAALLLIPVYRRLFQESKFLIAVRDPRDVVLSCYLRYLPLNPVTVSFLTIERTVQRLVGDMGAWQRLREILAGSWLEIRYEDVVSDWVREARRCVDFLGLAWDDSVLQYRDQAIRRSVFSPSYETVTQPVFHRSVGRWQNYVRYLEPVLEQLEPILHAWNYT